MANHNGLGKYLNESEKSNIFKLNSYQKLFDKDGTIEKIINVDGFLSDKSGITKFDKSPTSVKEGFDRNKRRVNLEFISPIDRTKYATQYPNDAKPAVWVVSHGWCDTRTSFKKIAEEIKQVYPDDIVFTLDWSEAGFNDCGVLKCGTANCPEGVRRAATWIEPVADSVKLALQAWGFNDNGNNLRVAGHSLGSILSGELSNKYEKKAAILIAMDPPSENNSGIVTTIKGVIEDEDKKYGCIKSVSEDLYDWIIRNSPSIRNSTYCYLVPKYAIDETLNKYHESLGEKKYRVNTIKDRGKFNEQAQRSRAFYGKFSFAGNRTFAATAHESYEVDYHMRNVYADKGVEHQHIVSRLPQK